MSSFYVNNSSLPITTCAKRYYLTVGRGLKTPPGGSKYTTIGLAFHDLMAEAKVGESTGAKGLIAPPDGSFLSKITSVQRAQVALLAEKILTEHPEMFGPDTIRERWFEIPLDVPGPDLRPVLCGTIDHIMYDPAEDAVIITDYKSTAKPLDTSLETSYQLTFQRWFYMIAAELDDSLPDNIKAAIKAGRLKFRYCFANYETNTYLLQTPEWVSIPDLDRARVMLMDKILLAQAIVSHPELAIPEGTMNGACFSCPFKSICAARTLEESKQLEDNWFLGYKPYYPRHDDK
jgi:hypothetical protein